MNTNATYIAIGFKDRTDYLEQLAKDYGVDFCTVRMLADMFGPKEDFDALICALVTESW